MKLTEDGEMDGSNRQIHLKFTHLAIGAAAVLALASIVRFGLMHSVVAGVGEEIVFIDQPYVWGKAGVDPTPLTTGRKTVFNTTQAVVVKTYPEPKMLTFELMPGKDDVPVEIELVAVVRVTNSPAIIEKFGPQWFNSILYPAFTPIVREAVGKRLSTDLVNDSLTQGRVQEEIADGIRRTILEQDLKLELVNLAITKIKFTPQEKC